MVVVLDISNGEEYHFTQKKTACAFLGITAPTLRAWLKGSYYLHKTLIIIHTSNEKAKETTERLLRIQEEIMGRGDDATERKAVNGKETPHLVRG